MSTKYIFLLLLLGAVLLALVISPFASPWPDGLERVAEDRRFIEKGDIEPVLHSPVPDYVLPGVKNEKVATALAGVLGTLLTFGVAYGVAALLRIRKGGREQDAS